MGFKVTECYNSGVWGLVVAWGAVSQVSQATRPQPKDEKPPIITDLALGCLIRVVLFP